MDMSAFDGFEFRAQQDVAMALIATSDCGIIETNTGWGKSMIVALVCKAYPTLNIVVATRSTQVVSTLYEYLCKTIPGEVGIVGCGQSRVAGKRVIVSTLKSLPNIAPDNVQLLVVDECHDVGANDAGKAVMQFCWARRFGFSASPIRNDGSGLMMESLLGPTILKMEYQEAVEAGMVVPMRYMMLTCTGCPPIAKKPDLSEVMLKRMSYWVNRSRNGAIRQFVYALKEVYDGQILIMVSTLEAAIQLHMMLPWFKVAYYGSTDLEDMAVKFPKEKYPNVDLKQYKMTQKQLDVMRAAFGKGTLKWIISTKVFKQGCNFPHLRCLIRADGDVSSIEGIQIPGRLARLDEGKDCAYLVDIDDQFSQWAHNRSQARERLYQQMQWTKVSYQEVLNGLGNRAEGDGGKPVVEPRGGN
jgi:superfamily II DNA or RNA helicase